MPSVLADYRIHDLETTRLLSLCAKLSDLPPVHRKLVAEIILLRLFDLFENLVSSVAKKLVCGAAYVDGSAPILAATARSLQGARDLFQAHGRQKQKYQLSWSTASEIKDNIRYVIDQHENVLSVVDRHASLIDELRCVRNRIAHNNAMSRKNYRKVVRRHYGAYMNHVTPGVLLLTSRKQPALIEQYIKRQRIIVKDVVKA